MKKSFLLKLFSLILMFCAMFTLLSACNNSESENDDGEETKCTHEYAQEFTCIDRECLECGEVLKASTEHVYEDEATCHDRTCECGYVSVAATEHEYVNGLCACGLTNEDYIWSGSGSSRSSSGNSDGSSSADAQFFFEGLNQLRSVEETQVGDVLDHSIHGNISHDNFLSRFI